MLVLDTYSGARGPKVARGLVNELVGTVVNAGETGARMIPLDVSFGLVSLP